MSTDLYELLVTAKPTVEPLSTEALHELHEAVFGNGSIHQGRPVATPDESTLPEPTALISVRRLGGHRPRRRRLVVAGWLAVAATVVWGIVVVRDLRDPDVAPPAGVSVPVSSSASAPVSESSPAETTSSMEPTTTTMTNLATNVAANLSAVSPTLLTTTNLPVGLTLSNGGTTTSSGPNSVAIYRPDDPSHRYLISWQQSFPCSDPQHVTPGVSRNRDDALSSLLATATNSTLPFETEQAAWCQGDQIVSVNGSGLSANQLATLAATVQLTSDHRAVTFDLPASYRYLSIAGLKHLGALKFSGGDRHLEIMVSSGAPEELAADNSLGLGTTNTTIGGRTVYKANDGVQLSYDDHTLVFIDYAGLTNKELDAVVAGLTPADPSLAPPVSDNCDDLHLCG